MIRIAITGPPKSGKSTVCRKILDELRRKGVEVSGMITSDMRTEKGRVGFKIEDLSSGDQGILAHVSQQVGPKVSKYRVNIEELEKIGVEAIKKAGEITIVDEIGPMELFSKEFVKAVHKLLDSDKNLIFTIHKKAEHELIRKVREKFEVFEINPQNREKITDFILQKINKEV
jgi:nucleoside-triphosphatase